ncbi:flavin reductase family protein [Aeromicrobium fastidiosum]|uniref:Flavin reductase family protein n=1 Tax=Aeromicrobium fastidiosum TaxID=52699 RepID=A0A641APE5_9ACTN|nr:flavin reductase family protein [Aeromicrobium fastidiosum]KAA1379805.1 flavin reductase family protein [Aeromicrobium fastidiosum]MBP2389297.1 flavin reductase (DIM6/NTAB) family NADH-FMN oxidoreductase RutF [Aeromicrobium fastidiosum]
MSTHDDTPATDPAVLQKSFRSAMGNVAAAVSVVTTFHDGAPHGTTVSAFSSLSMDPPMLLVSLDNRSQLLAKLEVGSRIGVNVLAAHQDQIALRFAGKGDDKFLDVPWQLEDGAPALSDRHAWVALTVAQLVVAGDHTLVLGDVEAADTSSNLALTYWQRAFGSHQSF